MRADPEELLRLAPFRHLPIAALEPLLARAPLLTVERGATVIQERAPGTAALLLLSGRLQVSTALGGRPLGITLPGRIVGEGALLGHAPPRSARVVALEAARLLLLEPSLLRGLEGSAVGTALELAVLRGVSEHLRASTRTLAALAPPSAAGLEANTAQQPEAPTLRMGCATPRERMWP